MKRQNQKGMILAIDMGNTNIVIGCVDDEKIYFEERLCTDYSKTELEYAIGFKTVLELYNIESEQIHGAIISSVVPQLVNVIKSAVEKIIGITPLIVGPDGTASTNQSGSSKIRDWKEYDCVYAERCGLRECKLYRRYG